MKNLISLYVNRAFPLVSKLEDGAVKRNILIDSVWLSVLTVVLTG